MSDKPVMKREAAVANYVPHMRFIYIHATPDAIEDFREFGEYLDEDNRKGRELLLEVDSRYDFYEVLKYISEYGND